MVQTQKYFARIYMLTGIILLITIFNNEKLAAQTSGEIYQNIKKLDVLGSVLYIAAHPDDENTRLISFLSREKLYRTGYISLTRGDGGQNLIGSEQGVDLGLIRTRELLAARGIDGGEQFFTRAYDFGYSKTAEETFRIWNKEQVLEDVVFVIRKFKPDVIICRFPADSRAGHGHHTASAIIAREAFDAAADPLKFPEQVTKFGTWQAKRILWNTFSFGSTNTTSEDQLKIDVGSYNSILGKSYGEIAAESRSQHKSQGFGVPRQRGNQKEYFIHLAGDSAKTDLLDGVKTKWSDVYPGNGISVIVENILKKYNFSDPSTSLSELIKLRNQLKEIKDSPQKTQKLKDVEKIILDCCGFWTECYASSARYAEGDSVTVQVQMINRSDVNIKIMPFENINKDTIGDGNLQKNVLKNYNIVLSPAKTISQPYWLNTVHSRGMFILNDLSKTGKPWNDPALTVDFKVIVKGEQISVSRPVIFKHTDPVKGELFDPLTVSPLLTANTTEQVLLFTEKSSKKLSLRFNYWGQNPDTFSIQSKFPGKNTWKISPSDTSLIFSKKGEEKEIVFTIAPFGDAAQPDSLTFIASNKRGSLKLKSIKDINYEHIPPINWYPDLNIGLRYIPMQINTHKIAYIKGAGDLMAPYLRQLGYEVDEVNAQEILLKDISTYDVIIAGIRAYNTDDRLPFAQEKLMNYVKNGGIYLVQYNTNGSNLPKILGPYPFSVSRNRVTEEDASVSFVDPLDPLLNKPNKISQSDFDGWIQERGIYFPEKADSSYRKLLVMNDAGEQALDGSTIIANYGKGRYVYTGLVFFRQIPAGIPGAIRLFVNLISK
jgi:LmbE family N-acetylglucosaminyl deacetylase